MPVRPPSSARPGTSASDMRPMTSSGAQFAPYDPALEEEEEEFDESDDEDVFAFLPPTTAEQEEQQAQINAGDAAAGGDAAYRHQQEMGGYPAMQYAQNQGTSPYALGGAGTAAAAHQAQYYAQQQQQLPPHLQQRHESSFSPFSFSHFPNGAPADPSSTSTFEIDRGTTGASELSSTEDFEPWGRPGTSHGASHQAGPSNLRMASNNPYSAAAAGGSEADAPYAYVPDNHAYTTTTRTSTAPASITTTPTAVNATALPTAVPSNSNAAYTHPRSTLPPPRSPPSPSTDSHPSTGAGMSAAGHMGDIYKLRRLTSTNSVAASDAAPSGVPVEGGRRVVQSDDDEDDEEEYDDAGAEGEDEARRRRKEVRVSLPGTQAKRSRSRSSRGLHHDRAPSTHNPQRGAARPEDDEDEGTSDTAGSETDRKPAVAPEDNGSAPAIVGPDAAHLDANHSGKRRKRSGKHRSKPGSGTAGAYAGDAGAAEAGAVNTLPYVGAVASGIQIRSRGHGERRRNPNAQPYAGYAALANASGYDYGARGSRPTTHGTMQSQRRPVTANTQTQASGTIRRTSTSGSFVTTGKRRLGKGDELEDEYDDGEDGDSMSMSGMSGGSIRDDESREGSIKMEFDFDAIEDEDSPFPEVRASVSNIDDPDMPAMTVRMWFVGLLLCMTSSALNVFFNFRSPAPSIVPLVLLLVSYPFGKFLAFSLPITTYRIPMPNIPRRWFPAHQPSFAPCRLFVNLMLPLTYPRTYELSLNPGPWNIKEHVLVYIMANVATGNPYALNAIVVSDVFYHIKMGYWFSLTLVLATQLTGFGLAGLCRRFLVWPASMVWPQNLVACTLLNTLHAEDDDDGIGMYGGTYEPGSKGMSRYKFFIITTMASFVFFFLPGYLFEALSIFSFVCWAAPNNVPVNQLFGVRSGLGMSVITFDWTQISWIGSPLMVPWWAELHIMIGFVLFFWILTPILYYTNSWDLAYFPISANEPYDRFGNIYDVQRILSVNDTFDQAEYFNYSPLYLPATYAMTYLLAFALSTCVIVHTGLYHGKALFNGLKKVRVEADDIHAKLMRNYPEVPDWWYLIAFATFFGLAVVTVEVWDTGVPVWALLLSVMLPVVYVLPSGFIYAMTGQGITINILAQIIPGTLLPGKPLVNMLFKAYSVQTLSAATSFVQDLKLGHYVKVPPRATFMVQMISTILAAFIQVGVKEWIFANVEDICDPNQKSQLTCPHNQVFFTASAVWGLVGPTKQFGTGSIYHPHLYAIIVGAFLPLPFYFWQRKYPKSWTRYVSTPVILNGVSSIPPATGINYSSWFAVGFAFQYLIRKRNFAWWSKFNYVLSSALDSGTVIAVIIIFFTLQFPRGGSITVNWWGNLVFQDTADWNKAALLPIPPGGVTWTGFPPATDSAGLPLVTAP